MGQSCCNSTEDKLANVVINKVTATAVHNLESQGKSVEAFILENKVMIFTKSTNPFCKKVVEQFQKYQIPVC